MSADASSSAATATAAAVPLHRPERTDPSAGSKPPVWAIDGAAAAPSAPVPAKCARHADDARGGVCCKELKPADERQLVDPDVVRDVVIGLSDGLTVPFALTAGLSSLGSSRVVVLGGVAELLAGAISMGVGGFLAAQAERDHFRYLRRTTRARVARSCAGEMEREVRALLAPLGVDDRASRAVAAALLSAEEAAGDGARGEARAPDAEAGLRWSKDVGLSAFLLKFGEGLEEVPDRRMYVSAFTIGMGYLVGGLIPLLPYLFIPLATRALVVSSLLTGAVLLLFGVVKARVSGAAQSWRDYVWGALTTMLVGGAAAGVAYGVVALLETKTG